MPRAPRIPRRLIAPIVLVALIVAIWALGLGDRLSWAGLARNQASLTGWVSAHPLLAPCLYVAFYVGSVALSLPQAGLLTLIGGLLFGALFGGVMAVIGATVGAILLFLIARSALATPRTDRGGTRLGKLRQALARDGVSYLLALRLVPVVPFWLVNLAAALCGMRLLQFAVATLIGILPTTFITASIGAGLGQVLSRGETPNVGVLLSWPILGPLLGLAVLSLLPVVWRRWRTRDA